MGSEESDRNVFQRLLILLSFSQFDLCLRLVRQVAKGEGEIADGSCPVGKVLNLV